MVARVSAEDEDKRSKFESLGFEAEREEGGGFNIEGREVTAVKLSLTA